MGIKYRNAIIWIRIKSYIELIREKHQHAKKCCVAVLLRAKNPKNVFLKVNVKAVFKNIRKKETWKNSFFV
jgi:hypothetical protein